jgi:hypothetical protein
MLAFGKIIVDLVKHYNTLVDLQWKKLHEQVKENTKSRTIIYDKEAHGLVNRFKDLCVTFAETFF